MTFLNSDFLTVPMWFWLMILAYIIFIPCCWLLYRRWLRRLDIRLGAFLNDFLAWHQGAGFPKSKAIALARSSSGIKFLTLRVKEKPAKAKRAFVDFKASIGLGLSTREGTFIAGQGPLIYPVSGSQRAEAHQLHAFVPQVRPMVADQLWPLGDRILPPLEHDRHQVEQLHKGIGEAFEKLFDKNKVSVAVQHRSRLIFESYAEGFEPGKPQLFKAITPFAFATVFGLLAHQRRLAIEQAVPEEGWEDDSRNQIRFIDLLKSVSGLTPVSEKQLMVSLFQPNPGIEQPGGTEGVRELILNLKQTKANGEVWDSSTTSVLALSHLLSLGFGDRTDIYRAFVRRSLFDKLGMVNSAMAVTVDGLVQTWSGLMSTPRDLLRLASLYQTGGFWQGERLLEESWLTEIANPVLSSGHTAAGIQSVLNTFAKEHQSTKSKMKVYLHGPPYAALPTDSIFALRDGRSVLIIIPSEKVSIVLASPEQALPDLSIESFARRILTSTQTQGGEELRADPDASPIDATVEIRLEQDVV